MKIKFLITGGTIDKVYDEYTGLLNFTSTNMEQMISRSKTTLDISSEVLFLKDSLDITDENRKTIMLKCCECPHNKIVISHGTDTMIDTAKLLAQNISNKGVVLFGSMIPYAVHNSEALFNLGVALSFIQTVKSGIYIAMNGKIFDFDNVRKNKMLGIFENLH